MAQKSSATVNVFVNTAGAACMEGVAHVAAAVLDDKRAPIDLANYKIILAQRASDPDSIISVKVETPAPESLTKYLHFDYSQGALDDLHGREGECFKAGSKATLTTIPVIILNGEAAEDHQGLSSGYDTQTCPRLLRRSSKD